MILDTLDVQADEFARRAGWHLKPEGACRGDICVPLAGATDVPSLAARLGMPVVADEQHGLWAVGPSTIGGKALLDARMPPLMLPDRNGNEFSLESLRGQKVMLLAWASW